MSRAEIIQAIDLRQQKRTLRTDMPLDAPWALYLEPASLCNAQCAYCPTGDRALRKQRPNGLMSMATFRLILKQLIDWNVRLKRVNLYKDGEPLLNPDFPDFVRALKDCGATETAWVKTNGLLLNTGRNQQLATCGLDMIGISVQQVSADGYRRISKVRLDYDRFRENIADLYARCQGTPTRIYIKIADAGLLPGEIEQFYEDFGDRADFISVEYLHGWSDSKIKDFQLGTHPDTFEGWPLVEKLVCPLPFYLLAVNWNGTVSLCNEDWAQRTLVGNIHTKTLRAIWYGEALHRARLAHLSGRRAQMAMCQSCDYSRTLPDFLDDIRADLLVKLCRWRADSDANLSRV